MDVDNSLVDSHFISIPGVSSFTAWRFSAGDSQDLGWNSHWSASFVASSLRSLNDLAASLLEWLDLSSLQSDSNNIKLMSETVKILIRMLRMLFRLLT